MWNTSGWTIADADGLSAGKLTILRWAVPKLNKGKGPATDKPAPVDAGPATTNKGKGRAVDTPAPVDLQPITTDKGKGRAIDERAPVDLQPITTNKGKGRATDERAPVETLSLATSVPPVPVTPANELFIPRLKRINDHLENADVSEQRMTAPASAARVRAHVRALDALLEKEGQNAELVAAATEMRRMWKLLLVDGDV